MRRFNTGYQDGKYEFPSGHIEKGETLTDAVIREAQEEIGIIVKEDDLSFVACVDNNANGKHVNFLFKTEKFEGTPSIKEPEACDDIMWKNIENLTSSTEELSVDAQRFIEMIKNHFILKSYS
ncbi:hypothetical protein FACS1894176_08060 [Bacteroidia bacterium]|nr:hypothetical protein FACS1894176_08060 [Bacteroidia bacterium]